jgi:hypothetical protein
MINFNFDSTTSVSSNSVPGQKAPMQPTYAVTSVLYNKEGKEMVCVFDSQEIRLFRFNEECNIAQIESDEVLRDIQIPVNAIASWGNTAEQIIMIN